MKSKILYIFFVILIILSGLYIAKYYSDMYNSKQEGNLLNEVLVEDEVLAENNVLGDNEIMQPEPVLDVAPKKTERILKLEKLQSENSDIVAWLEIENTDINYPVLQGLDNSYYMNHNYKKEYSFNGSIFLDKDYVWDPPSSNLLIYGHNMKNGTMFQELLKYKDKKYFDEHPIIRFTTNNEDAYYEIIAVFYSRIYYKYEKNVFRYYFFINAENEYEYNNFVVNAKKASIYDTGKTASFGDQLMTLSTCSYHTKDGRFAIVAKKTEI